MIATERRLAGRERVPFEALVVIANAKNGEGPYECEAVDVSVYGMHLRTAYLPEVGENLMCRFDTGRAEVAAQGNVVWRQEQARGGEFGIAFKEMESEGLAALYELCGVSPDSEQDMLMPEARVAKGARVRLHVEGLGAPMRARVREGDRDAVEVGSNLDFLRMGRPLELEDVEKGQKHSAVINQVGVDVDPGSQVPQLVVTLKYGDSHAAYEAVDRKAEKSAEAVFEVPVAEAPLTEHGPLADQNSLEEQLGLEGSPWQLRSQLWAKGVMDSFVRGSSRAREAIAAIKFKVIDAKRAEEGQYIQHKRVTSPPPDGALHTSGRRVIRDKGGDDMDGQEHLGSPEDENKERPKLVRRALAIGGAATVAITLTIIAFHSHGDPPGAPDSQAAAASSSATISAGAPAFAKASTTSSGDTVTANVPLFGNTPLSTTEPAVAAAPMGPSPGNPSLGLSPSTTGATPAVVTGPASTVLREKAPGATGSEEGTSKSEKGNTIFGKGVVKRPRTLRLKMDGPLAELIGTTTPKGFTLTLPNRHTVEPVSLLAKDDRRIASVKRSSDANGNEEVMVTFKGKVTPPFLARVEGSELVIALGETPHSGLEDNGDDGPLRHHSKKHHKGLSTEADAHNKSDGRHNGHGHGREPEKDQLQAYSDHAHKHLKGRDYDR